MRRIIPLLTFALIVTACGESAPVDRSDDSSAALAAAVLELVTKNHTFGDGPPPFDHYLIQDRLDPSAGTATGSDQAAQRELTDAERSAIETALEGFGPVEWIDDPTEYQTDDLAPTIEGAVILGVGEPSFDGEAALVPVSLWCGGLCGTWLTYRLAETDQGWVVTGIEGPIAVS